MLIKALSWLPTILLLASHAPFYGWLVIQFELFNNNKSHYDEATFLFLSSILDELLFIFLLSYGIDY